MSQSERYVAWTHRGGLQGVWGALMVDIALIVMAIAGGALPRGPFLLTLVVGSAVGYAIGKTIGWTLLTVSGKTAQAFTFPATTGFYVHEHSEIDTLEVRGDFKGAVSAWEAVAIAEPDNPWPLVRSGDLYARKLGDPALAVERYRLAASIPTVKPEIERYASQKIIDLLLGALDDRGGAMVELRKLIDRYPSSREAEGARKALRALKAE
jgi:hypothetical protein